MHLDALDVPVHQHPFRLCRCFHILDVQIFNLLLRSPRSSSSSTYPSRILVGRMPCTGNRRVHLCRTFSWQQVGVPGVFFNRSSESPDTLQLANRPRANLAEAQRTPSPQARSQNSSHFCLSGLTSLLGSVYNLHFWAARMHNNKSKNMFCFRSIGPTNRNLHKTPSVAVKGIRAQGALLCMALLSTSYS